MAFRATYIDPGLTIADLVGRCWRLVAICDHCGRAGGWTAAQLEVAFPAGATVGAVAARLVCSGEDCESRDGRLEPRQDPAASQANDLARLSREPVRPPQ